MILADIRILGKAVGIPRMSGDDPLFTYLRILSTKYSPHERG